jgi:hypothetical protein
MNSRNGWYSVSGARGWSGPFVVPIIPAHDNSSPTRPTQGTPSPHHVSLDVLQRSSGIDTDVFTLLFLQNEINHKGAIRSCIE